MPDATAAFVMPVHFRTSDGPRWLRESLASLAGQSDPAWTLIAVIDPGSAHATPADTAELVEETMADLGRPDSVTTLTLDEPSGPGVARNLGVRHAAELGHPLVFFLDSDDIARPNRLARQRAALARPGVRMSYSAFDVIDEEGRRRAAASVPPSIQEILARFKSIDTDMASPWQFMACEAGYMSLTSSVAVHTDLALATPFPATHVSEDLHVWLRMFAASPLVAALAEPLVSYRLPEASGGGTRGRYGDDFYWIKGLVDTDALVRVLLVEVGAGRLSAAEATEILDRAFERSAVTAEREGVSLLADTLRGLSHL